MAYMILKKVLSIIPLLLLVSVILFVLINLLPGDAAMGMVTEGASEDYVNRVRAEMGLDKPPVTRYFDWLIGIFRGDLGKSLISNQLVSVKIAQRLPVTLEITFVAMVISILIAVPLGILSAVRRGSIFDTIGSFVSMLGIAMPPFWLKPCIRMPASTFMGKEAGHERRHHGGSSPCSPGSALVPGRGRRWKKCRSPFV